MMKKEVLRLFRENFMRQIALFTLLILVPADLKAASSLNGQSLSLAWAIPFIGMLLSLSLFPLLAPKFWHKHFGFISLLWALSTLIMTVTCFGLKVARDELILTYVDHFLPFIIFVLAFYVISSGIKLDFKRKATPLINALFITIAGLFSSVIGTTGASMLFIHSFIKINSHRKYKTHLIVFFILIVCNVGGCLSAIGDPPLFLGYLNGVDFFWPTTHLFPAFLTVFIPLILTFFTMDLIHYRKQYGTFKRIREPDVQAYLSSFKISGQRNIPFLIIAVTAIILSGLASSKKGFDLGVTTLTYSNLARDLCLLILALLSFKFTPKQIHLENDFSWDPFTEVFKVFAAIFLTAAPVLAMLKAGSNGPLSILVDLVTTPQGPDNSIYFWLTGVLSSVLDNAPTYLVFFNLAGGNAEILMHAMEKTLIAISLGAVFMGALTYIGNAPNFMVRAIAEQCHIRMPNFFGYILWSTTILIPLFVLVEIFWVH